MKIDHTSTSGFVHRTLSSGTRLALNALIATLFAALVGACASPPPPPPAPTPAPRALSKTEITVAALKAMNFEPRDDGWHLSLPAPLIFAFDSDVVAAGARDTLLRVGRELNELGIDRALVRGHTDNVGTAEYNQTLSKRRADAVARVLMDGGYPTDRIDAKGLGATVPTADNASAEGRSQNRRVVIIVQVI